MSAGTHGAAHSLLRFWDQYEAAMLPWCSSVARAARVLRATLNAHGRLAVDFDGAVRQIFGQLSDSLTIESLLALPSLRLYKQTKVGRARVCVCLCFVV